MLGRVEGGLATSALLLMAFLPIAEAALRLVNSRSTDAEHVVDLESDPGMALYGDELLVKQLNNPNAADGF